MNLDLDRLEALANAVGGDQWTPTYATRTDLAAVWLPDGDLVCRCHGNIGHWPDPINADDVAEFIAAAKATMLALIAEVRALREAIKKQARAAIAGMDAAKRTSTIQLQLAEQARAESSPDVLASERAMNAMLTEENERMRTLLDHRPAVNAGLVEAYMNWTAQVYASDHAAFSGETKQ